MAPSMAAGCDRTADTASAGSRRPIHATSTGYYGPHPCSAAPGPGRGALMTAAAALALLGCARSRSVPLGPTRHRGGRAQPGHGGDQRPGGAGPSPRRHRHRTGQSRNRGRVPRGRRPLRDDPVEPRHQPRRRPGRRRLRLRRQPISGFSLTHLSGTGCPSYQDVPILPTVGAIGTAPETTVGDLLAHPGARHTRSLPGRARARPPSPSRSPSPRAAASRASTSPPARRPTCSSRSPAASTPSRQPRVARRGARRGRGAGDERSVLPDGDQLHPALRGPLRPALLLERHLGQLRHVRREHGLHGTLVRRLRHVRHDDPSARSS